ncbi:hypothetical protein ACCS66_38340, partial [Rhizobium ruizarguesonis]
EKKEKKEGRGGGRGGREERRKREKEEKRKRERESRGNRGRTKGSARKGAERTERRIITTREMRMESFNSGNLDVPVFGYGDHP